MGWVRRRRLFSSCEDFSSFGIGRRYRELPFKQPERDTFPSHVDTSQIILRNTAAYAYFIAYTQAAAQSTYLRPWKRQAFYNMDSPIMRSLLQRQKSHIC